MVLKPLDEVEVYGKMIQGHASAINTTHGTPSNRVDMFQIWKHHEHDALKWWLAQLIFFFIFLYFG